MLHSTTRGPGGRTVREAVAPAPWARACALAGSSTVLAGAAHAGAGGSVPPLVLAVLAVALVPVVRSWLDREASGAALLAVVSAVQLVLHVVLGWSAMAVTPGLADPAAMAGHDGMPGTPTGLATVLALPSGWMLAAHTAAVLVVVALLRHAEAALCATVRVARAAAARLPLAAAVRLAAPLPALPAAPADVPARSRRTPGPQVLLHDVLSRRGPPVPVS